MSSSNTTPAPQRTRVRIVAATALLLTAAVLVGVWLVNRSGAGTEMAELPRTEIERGKRSVIVVTLDTTRADHLAPYGATDVETPNLSRLAERGVLFEQAISTAPITLVAHTTILSGLYPPQHKVRNNGIHYVPEEVETLAEVLSAEGYRTAAFVSAAVLEKHYNLTQGFELYDDDLSTGRERHPRMVPDRPAEATIAATTKWLDSLGEDEEFLVWAHFYDPHAPYSPPPPYRDDYRDRLYDGEIAYLDAQLGKLFDHPRLRDQAVTIVMGDHGESLGEHGEQTHAILAYDSTLHVPFIMRIPGGPQDVRVPFPVSQVDVKPTILDLLDIESDAPTAGRSLIPIIEGVREPGMATEPIYSETYLPFYTYGWAKLKTWRMGQWKYVEAPTPELYDMRRDPKELSNQAAGQPGLTHDLSRDLDEFLDSAGDSEGGAELSLDSESMEKLRALGYIATGTPAAVPEGERLDPKDVIDLHTGLERSRAMMRDRLWSNAVAQLRQVLDKDPNNLAAMVDLATALANQDQVDEAIKVVERALTLDPSYVRLHIQLASLESRKGNNEQALKVYDVALGLDPNVAAGYAQKAQLLQRMQRRAEAEQVLSEGLERLPEDAMLHSLYAQMVEMRNGDLVAARERLENEVVARDPFLIQGWRLLGEVAEAEGNVEEAKEHFREGLRRQPDAGELHARLGVLLAGSGGGPETESYLREAIRLSPEFAPDLHVALGGWLAEHGRISEAQAEYEKVLAVLPGHPGARNNQAIALYRMGRLAEAEQTLRSLLADYPEMADAHNNLAAISIDRGDWEQAERAARKSLTLLPNKAPALNNLGIAVEEQGRWEEALSAYDKALEVSPTYWPARLNRGLLYSSQERYEDAAADLEQVITTLPQHPEAHMELGNLYAGPLDDPTRARNHYNAFLRYAPAHPAAAEVRSHLEDIQAPG